MLRIAQLISDDARPVRQRTRPRSASQPFGERRSSSTETASTTRPAAASAAPDPGRCEVAEPGRDDDPAEPRTERVGRVQRGVVERRAEGLGVAGDVHQPHLQAGHEHRRVERDEEDRERDRAPGCAPPTVKPPSSSADVATVPTRVGTSARSAARPPTTVPNTPPTPKASSTSGTVAGDMPATSVTRGRDVAVDGEHAAEARPCRRAASARPAVCRSAPSSLPDGRLRLSGGRRHEHRHRQHAQQGEQPRPPSTPPASPRVCPSQVAAGTPTTLAAASPSITLLTAWPAPLGGTSDAATSDGHPEERAVRQPGEEPGQHEPPKPGATAVTTLRDREGDHQDAEQPPSGAAGRRARRSGRAHDHPERVGGDEVPGVGDA